MAIVLSDTAYATNTIIGYVQSEDGQTYRIYYRNNLNNANNTPMVFAIDNFVSITEFDGHSKEANILVDLAESKPGIKQMFAYSLKKAVSAFVTPIGARYPHLYDIKGGTTSIYGITHTQKYICHVIKKSNLELFLAINNYLTPENIFRLSDFVSAYSDDQCIVICIAKKSIINGWICIECMANENGVLAPIMHATSLSQKYKMTQTLIVDSRIPRHTLGTVFNNYTTNNVISINLHTLSILFDNEMKLYSEYKIGDKIYRVSDIIAYKSHIIGEMAHILQRYCPSLSLPINETFSGSFVTQWSNCLPPSCDISFDVIILEIESCVNKDVRL